MSEALPGKPPVVRRRSPMLIAAYVCLAVGFLAFLFGLAGTTWIFGSIALSIVLALGEVVSRLNRRGSASSANR